MIYQYKMNEGFFYAMLTIVMIIFIVNLGNGYKYLLYFMMVLVVFEVILALLRFQIILHTNTLEYSVKLFKFVLYKKQLNSNEIVLIKFKRAGWASKTAIIKPNEGKSIRLSNFKPTTLYKELIDFAEFNNIEFSRSKDYNLLKD